MTIWRHPSPGLFDMAWIIAAFLLFVSLSLGFVVRHQHRRRLNELRAEHRQRIESKEHEHNQRLARLERDHDRQLRYAHHPLAEDLLPGLDGLVEAQAYVNEQDLDLADPIVDGLEVARRSITDALQRHGIDEINPEANSAFEPQFHEAISRCEDATAPHQAVMQCFRRGYRDGDRVLRPAMVEVNINPQDDGADAGASSADDESSSPMDS